MLYDQESRRQLQERASSVQDDLAGAYLEIVCTQGQPAQKTFLHMDMAFSFALKVKALPKSKFGKKEKEKAREKERAKEEKHAAAVAVKAAAKSASQVTGAERKKTFGWFGS